MLQGACALRLLVAGSEGGAQLFGQFYQSCSFVAQDVADDILVIFGAVASRKNSAGSPMDCVYLVRIADPTCMTNHSLMLSNPPQKFKIHRASPAVLCCTQRAIQNAQQVAPCSSRRLRCQRAAPC